MQLQVGVSALEQARQFLHEHRRVLIVARSSYAADDLVRSACTRGFIGVERYTLKTLVYALSSEPMNARELVPLRRVAREQLAAAIAKECRLSYLAEVARFPGFPRALARTLQDLRLNRITSADLEGTGRSGSDLAALLDAFAGELESRGFADYAARVEMAIEVAHSLTDTAIVFVQADADSASERELLAVLRARASAVFDLRAAPVVTAASCLDQVKQYVLSGQPAPTRADDATVQLISAGSESLEFVEIARQILHSDSAFDEMAILLRNPGQQAPLLREALERATIPAYFEAGTQRPDLGGRAFLALLRCRAENYSAARFTEYLSFRQAPSAVATNGWERLLRELAVIEGEDRWERRLTQALAADYALYERQPDVALAARIQALECLQSYALPLLDHLRRLPEQASWRDWIVALEALADFALESPVIVHAASDELRAVSDLGPVALADVMRAMEPRLLRYLEEERGDRYGKLFVSSIPEAQGMRFRKVFLPGLTEGTFPRPRREDPLLLDEQRQSLRIACPADDADLLRTALDCAEESAVFSYSRLDLASGRERVPSFYAIEVLKAAFGATADVKTRLEAARAQNESRVGWSAPQNPEESMDELEYDLSSYRAAYSGPSGELAWLGAVSPTAVRAIRHRMRRWQSAWSADDGLVNPDLHTAMLLDKRRLREHAWSASALQEFARCPYRFYLRGVLGLREMEDPQKLDRMDHLVRGQLYHRVLFHLFKAGDEDALERVDAVLEHLAREMKEELAPVLPDVWDAEVRKLAADLRGWLATREPDWRAAHAELSFGLSDDRERDSASSDEPVVIDRGYKLRGSIDLVERREPAGYLRVLDHKTGQFPRTRMTAVGEGEVLQPLLYSLAVESLLGKTPALARLSYATARGGYQTLNFVLDGGNRTRVLQVLDIIDSWMEKGFLPAAPKKEACSRCEYVRVCGPYEEIRIQQKSEPELKELRQIRSWS